jgi:DNA (cytosine-5)-methyltransferase 1
MRFMVHPDHRAISLFSNCGAGDFGYRKAGLRFDVMAELDERRLAVCQLNHPGAKGVPGDLRQTWLQVIEAYQRVAKKVRPTLLAACPPCQGLSSARHDRGIENDADAGCKDQRNLLVTVIGSVAMELKPRLIVVENVPAFLTRKIRHPETHTAISAANFLIDELSGEYTVFPIIVDLCDFGVPQSRKRTFLTFIRNDEPRLKWLISTGLTPYPRPKFSPDYGGRPVKLKDALREFDLPSLDAANEEDATSRFGNGLHCVPVWPTERYDMVAAIPANSGKSAWQNDKCKNCGRVSVGSSAATCPKCGGPLLRPVVKARNGRYRLIHGFQTSTYTRMHHDRPSATITTASGHVGSNNTIHPFENRLLSSLECALLQTIPRRFKWGHALKDWGHTNIREMIGEAVPPRFTHLHGKVLISLIEGRKPRHLLSAEDIRCSKAYQRLGIRPETL